MERFLGEAGFDRVPWLAVAFGAGIAAWFALPAPGHWTALLLGCGGIAAVFAGALRPHGNYPFVRLCGLVVPLVVAAGCGSVWMRSHLSGVEPVARPMVETLTGKVLSVEAQPAQARSRIVLATREPGSGRAIRVRLNLAVQDTPARGLVPGAVVRVQARIMPPAPPMLPGAYNFARTAWFAGLAATGSALGPPDILQPGGRGWGLAGVQQALSAHVRVRLEPDQGGIAAALATGDVGGIAESDAAAMRDSGLAHLLSVSGLHVSAVIGAVYLVTIKLLALWPWLALRVRLPVVAAGAGALAGIGYTLLTGAQVPTVRSCIGALLVLGALALGREPLSMRMLAVAAFLVLLLWPEAVVGPSFQMSFAAVLAIVALSAAGPVRRFLGPREEGLLSRALRNLGMILLTGVVIELALMPIGLHHFHRAGLYGAFANVVAIPLTTLVIMPAVLGGLALDLIGAGWPLWWIAGRAIALLLGIAHWVATRPGAVTVMPASGALPFVLFLAGGLWLALWSGRVRWIGLVPALAGAGLIALAGPADILVSGDGRHVGIVSARGGTLFVLRESRSDFARDNLAEIAGMAGEPQLVTDWPGARCNPDACIVPVRRGGRTWTLLLTRTRAALPERALAAACERVDLVVADRWLPRSCRPRWIKADRRLLSQTGGLTIDLENAAVTTVAQGEGRHGWWRPPETRFRPRPAPDAHPLPTEAAALPTEAAGAAAPASAAAMDQL